MPRPLRALIVEDSENDLLMMLYELERGGFAVTHTRVETAEAMRAALARQTWDIVLSDYHMPRFTGLDAVRLLREMDADTPLIIVSGTAGEETAVACMKGGAQNFIFKHRLSFLVPAVERELEEASNRRQKRRSETALEESERRYQRLLESIIDYIYTVRIGDGCATATAHGAGCESVTGYTSAEYASDPGLWLRMVPEEDHPAVLAQVALSLKGEETQPLEHRIRHKDGTLRWVRDTHVVRKDDCGRVLSYDGIIVDITERRAAEEELQSSERRYRWLVEHSTDFTGVLDKSGTFTFASPSVERVLGFTPREIQGANAFALPIHTEDVKAVREAFDRALFEPSISMGVEFRLQHKDGSWRTLETIGTNLLEDPEVAGILLNIRDITEKKNLETRILRAQRMESIGVLAGGIAHDLNNILSPILLSIEVLRMKLSDHAGLRMLDTIQSSAQRGADLIRQVLSFARGAEGQPLMVQPRHLILEVAKIIRQTFPKGIEIRESVPRDLWAVMVDPTHLHQVLMNICVNARDAMPEGGRLEISAENIGLDDSYCSQEPEATPGPYLRISVTDTGTGIAPEVLEHIFEPFFTTKEIGKGTGLGLSTVLGIVKNCGGFLKVSSLPGRGTTFQVHLPAHRTAVPAPGPAPEEEGETAHGELVLVVDDEAAVREMTRTALETHGYSVATAADGAEAVAAYARRKEEIRVVLTDLAMPFMDGRATIRALHKINPSVRVLVMSGLELDPQSPDLGSCALLKKPYTAAQLFAALRQALSDPPGRRPTDKGPPPPSTGEG